MLKNAIKGLARTLGLEIRRASAASPETPFDIQRRLVPNARLIFDVGAHVGDTACLYAESFSGCEVYAFEPFAESFATLAERLAPIRRAHAVNAALSSGVGIAELYVNGLSVTNSLLPRPADARRYFSAQAGTISTQTVPVTTVDAFRAERSLPPPDILKLDVQGHELAVIDGAAQTLAAGATPLVYTEVNFVPHYQGSVLFHELHERLAAFGYSLFRFFDLVHGANGQLRYGDALFVSHALRRDVIDTMPDEP